jgi:small subunit ribosomal protein S6
VNRDYDLGVIFNPEVSEEEIRSGLERIEQIVANFGGQIVKVNQWGRRRLAYPIERHRDGFYVFIDMILTPETVSEIERTLKVSEIVLRHMFRKRDPKAVQKEREEREARAAAAAAAPEVTTEEVEAVSEEASVAEEVSIAPAEAEEAPVVSEEEAPASVSAETEETAAPVAEQTEEQQIEA